MNYTLKRIWESRKAELEAADIKIVAEQNLLITPKSVIKLDPYTTTIQIQRILRPILRQAEEDRKAARNRKQVTLFEEKK